MKEDWIDWVIMAFLLVLSLSLFFKAPAAEAAQLSDIAPECRITTAELRHSAPLTRFKKLSGYPHGRTGYVIDHRCPLACGGDDDPANMQWQTIAEGKKKDRIERTRLGYLLFCNVGP